MENRIYLDHAATSWPKPPELSASFAAACVNLTANSGRSGYRESVESARVIFDAREALCAILGVADSENIIFTRGCTEGLNLILRGLLKPGDRVGVSPLEHNSVMRPLRRLVQERNIIAETLPAGLDGQLDFGLCRKIVQERRFNLICVAHASNVNGVIQDLTALRAVFAEVPLLVDAAQTAGVLPLNIEQEEIDFLCCSAHKGLLGPTGVGIAYLSPLYELAPLYDGGTGSHSESYEQPLFRPDRYESGTMNIHGIAAFQGVLSGFAERGLLGEKTLRLTQTLIEELSKLQGVRVFSPKNAPALCVSFNINGLRPEETALRLEQDHGILCRPGLHCSPAAHHHLGTLPDGTVRLAPGWGTTDEQIETALRAVSTIAKEAKH